MPEPEQLIRWVSSFDYPHCSESQSLSDLKSGIAICELVYDLILNKTTPKFLSQIIISNTNADNSLSNLSHALEHICRFTQPPKQIAELRPEELYYDSKCMVRVLEYLHKLYQQGRNSLAPRLSDVSQMPRRPPLPRQSLKSRELTETHSAQRRQDITERLLANSMVSIDREGEVNLTNINSQRSRSNTRKKKVQDQSPIKSNIIDPVEYSTKVLLCQWLNDIQLIKIFEGIEEKLPSVCRNGVIFIDLINWLNGKQVVLSQNAKFYNEFQTIEANYRKVLTFLSQFERMNPRYILSCSELAQGENEDFFWGLLDDIYHLHHNKISKFDRRYWKIPLSSRKVLNTTTKFDTAEDRITQIQDQKTQRPYKQTLEKHRASTKALTTQSSQAKFTKQNKENNYKSVQQRMMSEQQIEEVYEWLKHQGLSYSLQKSLKLPAGSTYLQDPLRNGNVVASLIMRLQIGKVNVIKEPTEQKHVKHNFREINLNCSRRALNLGSINPPYTRESILIFILKLKNTGLPKRPLKQIQQTSKIRQISVCVKQWLDGMQITDARNEFTKIATSVIKVDVCRETTPKIQENNISKILNYLKKIGMTQYLSTTYEDLMNQECDVVWDIVEDIYNLKFT